MVIVAWLRQENRLKPGGGVYSELRQSHCTPAWVTERDSDSKQINGLKQKTSRVQWLTPVISELWEADCWGIA